MQPWLNKSMGITGAVPLVFTVLIIACRVMEFEVIFSQVGVALQLLKQHRFCPSVLKRSLQIPAALRHGQIRFQDGDIMRPSKLHCRIHHFLVITIHLVKVPHPAKVAGRKACFVRMMFLDVFSGSYGSTFFRSLANCLANQYCNFHLRMISGENLIQAVK